MIRHFNFMFNCGYGYFCLKAVIIPPKQRQAFNQGGTFIFKGKNTLLAHYDESTAAHADIERVKSIALDSL